MAVITSLSEAKEVVRELRTMLLFSEVGANLPSYAEQHFLLALSSLEQAERFLALAALLQSDQKVV